MPTFFKAKSTSLYDFAFLYLPRSVHGRKGHGTEQAGAATGDSDLRHNSDACATARIQTVLHTYMSDG